ncbi:MAG: transglutaminase domain-containing protein [Chloroflexi bacterium]|nr:transglutaminase domain-containing protein [Chloroflexota bacterium]
MVDSTLDPLEYYTRPGLMTDAQEQASLLAGLPTDVAALCQVVQGLLLHMLWAERYGVKLPPERRQETEIRRVAQKLRRIQELDARPLTVARPLERRVVSECRDFSTLLCAMLRYQGVPARARCGFATYFLPDHYEDHWVCEYWQAEEGRWVMVDAQLDQFQRQVLGIQFDPLDVPSDGFLPAGKAWLLCRAGQADPQKFGIFDMHGLWFIRGDLVRDVAALNKTELLPWDGWGLADKEDKDISPADLALLDQAATLTMADNRAFPALRALYENDARLRVPPVIKSYHDTGVEMVEIGGLGC